MEIQENLVDLALKLGNYDFLVGLIAPFIAGDSVVLILAFLSGQGFFTIFTVLAGSFITMTLLDIFWFFLPRTKAGQKFRARISLNKKFEEKEAKIEKLFQRNAILILFFTKVLVGTRILTIGYLSIQNTSYKKFIIDNFIALVIWIIVLGSIGFMAGLGYYSLDAAHKNISTGALSLGVLIGVFYLATYFIRKRISE